MSDEFLPETIHVNPQTGAMEIAWSDGQKHHLSLMNLRRICPCATCAQERGENPHPSLIESATVKDDPKPKRLSLPLLGDVKKFAVGSMHHVGRYALGVTWQDNHNSIFTWNFLHELGSQPPNTL